MRRRAILWLLVLICSLAWYSAAAPSTAAMIPVTAVEEGIADGPSSRSLTSTPRLPPILGGLSRDTSAAPVAVYVQGVLALNIRPQPDSDPGYVTSSEDVVSLFRLAQQHGTIGLIAHNYLAGRNFFELSEGHQVNVLLSDGSTRRFQVRSIRRLQALSPWSPTSNFKDLDQPETVLTALQLFNQVYNSQNQVVFQTCIEAFGNPVWGRLFVIAEPVENEASNAHGLVELP